MELNICHLYPDLLNVYGDLGNILILKYRAEKRNIKVNIFDVSINDDFNGDNMDIVFFGGGQDYEQSIVSEDLKNNKKEALTKYVEDEKVLLAICGGYQLLGNYYRAPNGDKLEGLHILDIHTEGGDTRFIGNTIIYNEEFDETYVGFENHDLYKWIYTSGDMQSTMTIYDVTDQKEYDKAIKKINKDKALEELSGDGTIFEKAYSKMYTENEIHKIQYFYFINLENLKLMIDLSYPLEAAEGIGMYMNNMLVSIIKS